MILERCLVATEAAPSSRVLEASSQRLRFQIVSRWVWKGLIEEFDLLICRDLIGGDLNRDLWLECVEKVIPTSLGGQGSASSSRRRTHSFSWW